MCTKHHPVTCSGLENASSSPWILRIPAQPISPASKGLLRATQSALKHQTTPGTETQTG